MADVTVKTAVLELRTCKMTKSILKQLPVIGYHDANRLAIFKSDGNEDGSRVVGWVHGTVLGDDFKRWLIVMNRDRILNLARADLTGYMDPEQVERSEIRDRGASFHFVIDKIAERERWG